MQCPGERSKPDRALPLKTCRAAPASGSAGTSQGQLSLRGGSAVWWGPHEALLCYRVQSKGDHGGPGLSGIVSEPKSYVGAAPTPRVSTSL